MQYVKITFRDKRIEPINLSLIKWGFILEDAKTLVPYMLDSEREWSGRTLNKAEVVSVEPDKDYTEKMATHPSVLYRHKTNNNVVQCFEGKLPYKFDEYEKM